MSDPDGYVAEVRERYLRAFDAALRGNPERAARLAALEAVCGAAETHEEFRAASAEIGALLDQAVDELAPAWPQVRSGGRPGTAADQGTYHTALCTHDAVWYAPTPRSNEGPPTVVFAPLPSRQAEYSNAARRPSADTPGRRKNQRRQPPIEKFPPVKEGDFMSQGIASRVSLPLPSTSAPADRPAPRRVTVLVQGTEVQIPCPSWCVMDHDGHELVELADLAHWGSEVSVQLPTFAGGTESSITVHLASYPFSPDDDRSPHLSLASPTGESAVLTADLAETVAQGLERHAAMMRALSATV